MMSQGVSCRHKWLHPVTSRSIVCVLISVTLLMSVAVGVTLASQNQRKFSDWKKERRHIRSVDDETTTATNDQLYNILETYDTSQLSEDNSDLHLYTPTTPSPEDVNCHVHIPTVRYQGGKCVNIGTFVGCQSGVYLDWDANCYQSLGVPQEEEGRNEATSRSSRRRFFPNRRRQRNNQNN